MERIEGKTNFMTMMQTQPITGPAVWQANDFVNDESWVHHLNSAEIDGLEAMLAQLAADGRSFPHFTKADISIGPIAAFLDALAEELEHGRGFKLVRGLPISRYSEAEINTLFYAMGLYMGEPVSQNPRGDLLGTVMHVGDATKKETRVYETNLYLPYHTDPSDVVGLMCVRKAKSGGMSSLVSAAAIYNEIIKRRPELLALYYRPFCYAHLGAAKRTPIFSYNEGKLSCRYLRQYIELGHENMGETLSQIEIEALDLFDQIMMAPEMRIDMLMEPGDIQFANNYAVLHSRTAFEDHQAEDQRRKKLRLWVKMPNARQLAPEFPGRNGFSDAA
ncbi:MAG: TauD/TfdA family dioxygenase [Alphaproteobacteria bacterium]|jgi:hypothetical protein